MGSRFSTSNAQPQQQIQQLTPKSKERYLVVRRYVDDCEVYKFNEREGDKTLLYDCNTDFGDEFKEYDQNNKNKCNRMIYDYRYNVENIDNYEGTHELWNLFRAGCDQYDSHIKSVKDQTIKDIFDEYKNLVSNKIFHEEKGEIKIKKEDDNSYYSKDRGTCVYDVEKANKLYKKAKSINHDMTEFDNYVNLQKKGKEVFYLYCDL